MISDQRNQSYNSRRFVSSTNRESLHVQMYKHEQLRSSIMDIPIVPASISDSITSTTSGMDSKVFYASVTLADLHGDESPGSTGSNHEFNKKKYTTNGALPLEILFEDNTEYAIPEQSPQNRTRLTLQEFHEKYRTFLPVGVRSELRCRILQERNPSTRFSMTTTTISSHPIMSYRDEKHAIETYNPWFIYTELFHQCRVEYNLCHRSISMLSKQPLNKDILRELLVVLYGQRYMIKAPDLHTEFHLFVSDFWNTFQHEQPEQIWIDLQRLNETYSNSYDTNCKVVPLVLRRSNSIGSLSTVQQSNKTLKNEEKFLTTLVEL